MSESRLRVPLVVAMLLAVVAMFASFLGLVPFLALALIPGLNDRIQTMPLAVQVPLSLLQSLGVSVMAVLVVWLLMRWVCRRRLRDAGFLLTGRSGPLLLLGVAASLVLVLPTMLLLAQLGLDGEVPDVDGPVWAFVVHSLLFDLLHLVSLGGGYDVGERLAYLVWPTGFGFLAGALVLLTRSLWSAVGVHGGSHTANLLLTLIGVGEGGATAWVVVGAVYVLAGLVVLALWRDRGGGPVRFEH